MYPPVEASSGQDQYKVRSTCLSIVYHGADYKYYNNYNMYNIMIGIA